METNLKQSHLVMNFLEIRNKIRTEVELLYLDIMLLRKKNSKHCTEKQYCFCHLTAGYVSQTTYHKVVNYYCIQRSVHDDSSPCT